jgi:hypothetical protein
MNKKVVGVGIALLLALVGVRVGMDYSSRQDDRQLIRQALTNATESSKSGQPGGALDLLSKNLTMNSESMPVDRQTVAKFIRDQKPVVDVDKVEPQIIGEEGRVVTPVSLSLGIFGERTLPNVTMIFAKEDDRLYGIIPVKKWRMTEIRVPQESWTSLINN